MHDNGSYLDGSAILLALDNGSYLDGSAILLALSHNDHFKHYSHSYFSLIVFFNFLYFIERPKKLQNDSISFFNAATNFNCIRLLDNFIIR